MQVTLVLTVDDPELIDTADDTGLTEAAFTDLMSSLSGLGYSFLEVNGVDL